LAPFGQAVSEEKICLTLANQKQELLLAAIFVGQTSLKLLGQMEPNLAGSIYVRSSIKFLRFMPFGQQIWLPRAILVSDWLHMKKLYRVSYIDASCQVWFHLAKEFQGRRFV
jgi:hypothetical protein